MNCLIIDDEPLARDILESYVSKISYLTLIKSCKNAFEASIALQENVIDIVYIDIQMPDISGIKFIETLTNPPLVIFTTAYSHYALNGFELNAIDYLLKPISPERFLKATQKAKDLFDLKQQKITSAPENDFIFIKADYQTIKINYKDILYVEGLKDYVKIYTTKKMIMTLLNIKGIMEKLPNSLFIRVHKSYIVSIAAVEKIEKNTIIIGQKCIPIGDSFKDEFHKKMGIL